MAPAIESEYKDLLNPIKDPEKAFAVNISELLQSYLAGLHTGRNMPNFNSAALLIQGSASVYGKKVEYLYTFATQLNNSLFKQNKVDTQQVRKETKEKKEDKSDDLSLKDHFKYVKNLSVMKKKNTSRATIQKSRKSNIVLSIAIHLPCNNNEDKGAVFYDTRGEAVGNIRDFAMNTCFLLTLGWILLPTVNKKLVPSLSAVPDCYDNIDPELCDTSFDDIDIDTANLVANDVQSSPDEGFGSCPPSSACAMSSTPDAEVNSENNTETPMQIDNTDPPDEGIVTTPEDVEMQTSPDNAEGCENIAAESEWQNRTRRAIRQSLRRPLKTVQIPPEDDPLAGINIDKELFVRKKIKPRNCMSLPSALRRRRHGIKEDPEPISFYCARTFFSLDEKSSLRKSLLRFDSNSFEENSRFVNRIQERLSALRTSDKNKKIDPIEDEQEINVEEVECFQDADEDDDNLCALFDDNDINIEHELDIPRSEQPQIDAAVNDGVPPELPAATPELPAENLDAPSPDFSQLAVQGNERHAIELQQFVQTSDLNNRVNEWHDSVKPFLDLMDQRESFDINLYGQEILNSFEDNDRKQTKTFREICKNKEQWQIIRCFMALLPLANMGNVSLDTEDKEDGSEEIFVTLLSRKMHHMELEEFGHSDGSHP